jgi:demethylmenaquinone methyltransferase/2-methoxy-6-polyprenyl-1,4-benzoquinol methylase
MALIQKALIAVNKILSRKSNTNIYRDDFDNCAVEYDAVPTRKLLGKFTEDVLRELNIKPGMRCIDLGCGTGHSTEIIANQVSPNGLVIGYDISKSMLEIAKKRLEALSTTKFINKDMLVALLEQKADSVDLVTVFWALGYTEPNKVLKEIARVLIPGGQVAVLVNTQESLAELQKLVSKILIRHPFVLKYIPPINFPSNIRSFRLMVDKAGLKIKSLREESCEQSFDSGELLVSWMKTSGPCAGFRGVLKENRRDFVFNKIREIIDHNGGIKLTFRFLYFIGTK